MIRSLKDDAARIRRLNVLYKASGIKTRYSVIPDYGTTPEFYAFYPKSGDLDPFPDIKSRMLLYQKEALPIAIRAAMACLEKANVFPSEITHIITVSCTGMYAPGLDIELVEELGLSPSVQRTCINYMGCYAAFNALKVADAFSKADPSHKILIVGVELCTIHYQKNIQWDHVLSNALFGDGAAAVLVEGNPGPNCSLTMDRFKCFLVPDGKKDMAWNISNFGFEMTLSSYLPKLIRSGIRELCAEIIDEDFSEVDYFAIHPGGKGIIEAVEAALNINRQRCKWSWEVLEKHGNMSSVSVLYVLERIMDEISLTRKEGKVLAMAFGPGLTVETGTLSAVVRDKTKTSTAIKPSQINA